MVVIVQVTQNSAAAVVVAADADDNTSPSFVYKTSSSFSWSMPGGWTVMMTSQHLEQFSSEDR